MLPCQPKGCSFFSPRVYHVPDLKEVPAAGDVDEPGGVITLKPSPDLQGVMLAPGLAPVRLNGIGPYAFRFS